MTLQSLSYVLDAVHNLSEAGIEPARNEVSGIVKWLNSSLDALAEVDPALVSTLLDLASDVLPFGELSGVHLHSDAAHEVIRIAVSGAELNFPDVARVHLPDALHDLPRCYPMHISRNGSSASSAGPGRACHELKGSRLLSPYLFGGEQLRVDHPGEGDEPLPARLRTGSRLVR